MEPTHTPAPTNTPADPDALVRDMVRKRQRRRRTAVVSTVAAVVLTAAALVGAGLVRANSSDPGKAPDRTPAGVAGDKAGITASRGTVRVDLYLDYLCPECRNTERSIAPTLKNLAARKDIRLVYHPVAFLDDYSSPAGYSTRAASAAACAADAGRFEQYTAVLFDKQPPERGPGLSDARLAELGTDAGITDGSFARCVRDAPHKPWVTYVSDVAASRKVSLTPTVMVAGERIDVTGGDAAGELTRAVARARR
ncbi:thioredoxin domain-containing protein [Streptomyces sp. VRA16 Mangrove soil]|uniref:DsbA family protein n=1 Tax=Streptomyces sp. VRA16 Mangrove soil TaxID=2817434 RepID=UPI001A9F0F41|nr:thioredoxin domain-containing protein [Streptomyces sp. VRA16 Mangrove soil]MBO1337245.1 thioredoxin domain-containing protein [Streptomyces sp. VRA16 Mangrove soil]